MTKLRDKSFEEQLKEALVHTNLDNSRRKDYLERTAYDHIVFGGTPPDGRMWDNPSTPLIDLMDSSEIEDKLEKFYSNCNPYYTRETFEEDIRREITTLGKRNLSSIAEMVITLNRKCKLPEKYNGLAVPK